MVGMKITPETLLGVYYWRLIVTFLFLSSFLQVCTQPPPTILFGSLTALSIELNGTYVDGFPADDSAFRMAVNDINLDSSILPSTKIETYSCDTGGREGGALECIINGTALNAIGMLGPGTSTEATLSAIAASVYLMPQISYGASSESLSSSQTYPYFSRTIPPDNLQTQVFVDLIIYFYNQTNQIQWLNVSVICTADDYGVGAAKQFIENAEDATPNITIAVFQQFLVDATNVYQEVNIMKESKARVFFCAMNSDPFVVLMKEAMQQKIVGDQYVWFCTDGCTTSDIFMYDDKLNKELLNAERGLIGVLPVSGVGVKYEVYLQQWLNANTTQYPGAGTFPTVYQNLMYDATWALAHAIHNLYDLGIYAPNASDITNIIPNTTFIGISGSVEFDSNGDRIGFYNLFNLLGKGSFQRFGTWDVVVGLNVTSTPIFHSGESGYPDLDYQPQFDYWSCYDKEKLTDKTGKTIKLESVDNDPNNIDIKYECDSYIDCDNMSDESFQCTPSKVIGMIVMGIIVGIFVGIALLLIAFIVFFGCVIKRSRILYSGLAFLLILSCSCILGYISIYAWFGKPDNAACGFRVWLLGLSSISLVSIVFAKSFKYFTLLFVKRGKPEENEKQNIIVRGFKYLKRKPEIEIIVYWFICIIPGIILLILWTAISTPIADVVKVSGDKHYICTTGGATGTPGGLIFFFILFGYLVALNILGLFMSFVSRNLPTKFNENRFAAISEFNMLFTGVVVTTVFLILETISPFAAWIILLIGILYGFASTMFLHVFTKVIGIVITNRLKEAPDQERPRVELRKQDLNLTDSSGTTVSSGQ